MKIAIISNLYEPFARGGAEVIVKRTALEFIKQGHEVVIITTHPWREIRSFNSVISEEGLKVYRYAVPNIFFYTSDYKHNILTRLLWHALDIINIFSAKSCKNILKKEQPDLVITHNLIGMSYLIPSVVKSLSIKHIHVLHDIQLAVRSGLMKKGEENSWFVTGVLAEIYQSITRLLFRFPEIVVSPSKFLKSFYTEKDYFKKSQFEIIRNPIDTAFFIKKDDNKKAEKITFGYIGQLEKHKGIDLLQQVFDNNLDANLQVVGTGSLKEQVKSWADSNNRVDYKGKMPNKDLPGWYQQIDCLVLPTLTYENSPTVVYEALASGIPVIVSDIGGAAELVTKDEYGVVFKVGDRDGLVKSINLVKKQLEAGFYDAKKIQASVEKLDVKTYCNKLLSL